MNYSYEKWVNLLTVNLDESINYFIINTLPTYTVFYLTGNNKNIL